MSKMPEDIRWIQRFTNYEKAFIRLCEAVSQKQLNELERNGLMQRFEFTIDLSWKVMKDYLEHKGFNFKPAPKDTFRQAFQAGYIDYAQALIDGLDIRNELSHDYSEEKFLKAEERLKFEVFPALEKLYNFFLKESKSDNAD